MNENVIKYPATAYLKFGILSTIDSPQLPFLLHCLMEAGIENICVICDSKLISEKDQKIWLERTGDRFPSLSGVELNLYSSQTTRIPYYFVNNHNSVETLELLKDLGIHCLYNGGTPRKLSNDLISSVRNGIVNIHPGELPKYRGCSAVEWSIFYDDKVCNTAHFMSERYDCGPVILAEPCFISKDLSYQSIRVLVFREACILAGKVLRLIQDTNLSPINASPQSDDQGRHWPPMPDSTLEEVIKKINDKQYKYQVTERTSL